MSVTRINTHTEASRCSEPPAAETNPTPTVVEVAAFDLANLIQTIHSIGYAPEQLPVLLNSVLHYLVEGMLAKTGAVIQFDELLHIYKVTATCGSGLPEIPPAHPTGIGILGRAATSQQPLFFIDPQDLFDGSSAGVELTGPGGGLIAPLRRSDGRVIGLLILCKEPGQQPPFDQLDAKLLSTISMVIVSALTKVQLREEANQRSIELERLSTLARALISTIDLEELVGRIADEIVNVVGFVRCCIYIKDVPKRAFVPRAWRGYPDTIGRNPTSEGVVGDVARDRRALFFDSSVADPGLGEESEGERARHQRMGFARALGAKSFVAQPVLNGKNQCIGVVIADNRGRKSAITDDQRLLLSAFANQAGIAIDNAMLYHAAQDDFNKIRRLTEYTENVLLSIPAGIISANASGKILRCNRAAEIALRRSQAALRGQYLTAVLKKIHVPDAERSLLMEHFHSVLETGQSVYQLKLTPRYYESARVQKTLRINLSRLEYHLEPNGIVISMEDVSQEVALREQLEGVRRLADIGQLAAKMAHEVRNALSPIRAAAQFIRAEVEQSDSLSIGEWPEMIVDEVDNLNRLTTAMLDFAKPNAIEFRRISPGDFLRGCAIVLAPFLNEASVRVKWDIADDLPDIGADPLQLGQVVRNLVMNAAQSMKSGGELHISCTMQRREQAVAIRFMDTGPGIPQQDLERIFRPFVTTKPKGTGLGLPIVQKIVSAHGGRVEAENSDIAGACFTVTLPVTPPVRQQEAGIDLTPLISVE